MNWTLTAPIASFEKNYRFHPVTNKHLEAIIKYCMSKDDNGLILYMQHMLSALSLDDTVNFEKLPCIDQLLLLIRLRSLCIGPRVEIILEGEKDVRHKMSLIDVQKSINEQYLPPQTLSFPDGGTDILLHYPVKWTDADTVDYIHSYTIAGKHIDCHNLNREQKEQLLEQLSTDQIRSIQNTCTKLDDSILSMTIIRLPGDEPNISLELGQFGHILRLIYSDSYPNFIELMYIFVKIINMSLSDVMNLTPSDTQIYYQMFVKETHEREKAQEQANNQNNNSRSVPSGLGG